MLLFTLRRGSQDHLSYTTQRGATQLHEDDQRYRVNGAGVMAALRTAGLNLLRLVGFDSICEGLQAVMHDITALLAMA